MENFGVPSARVLKKIPKRIENCPPLSTPPLRKGRMGGVVEIVLGGPAEQEAGWGGRNCARRPRRAGAGAKRLRGLWSSKGQERAEREKFSILNFQFSILILTFV